jgi:hypothetical protein
MCLSAETEYATMEKIIRHAARIALALLANVSDLILQERAGMIYLQIAEMEIRMLEKHRTTAAMMLVATLEKYAWTVLQDTAQMTCGHAGTANATAVKAMSIAARTADA